MPFRNLTLLQNPKSHEATCAKFAQVQLEGNREVNRLIEFYNLDAIISVGYRVNSSQATAFRIWATERLKEYIIKGEGLLRFVDSRMLSFGFSYNAALDKILKKNALRFRFFVTSRTVC